MAAQGDCALSCLCFCRSILSKVPKGCFEGAERLLRGCRKAASGVSKGCFGSAEAMHRHTYIIEMAQLH